MEIVKFCFLYNILIIKEGYVYWEIFEELFLFEFVVCCVLGGFFVVCFLVKVIEWDELFKNCIDLLGCVVKVVYK